MSEVLYVFRCDDCGADSERWFVLGTAPDNIDCPDSLCRGEARRLMSKGAFLTVDGGYNSTYKR